MKWTGLCVLVVGLLAVSACEDDPADLDTGRIGVTVTTSGDGTDSDGYILSLDDGFVTQDIGTEADLTFIQVAAGEHSVELTDVSANCTVDGDNPQSVTVTDDEKETLDFSVTCTATS